MCGWNDGTPGAATASRTVSPARYKRCALTLASGRPRSSPRAKPCRLLPQRAARRQPWASMYAVPRQMFVVMLPFAVMATCCSRLPAPQTRIALGPQATPAVPIYRRATPVHFGASPRRHACDANAAASSRSRGMLRSATPTVPLPWTVRTPSMQAVWSTPGRLFPASSAAWRRAGRLANHSAIAGHGQLAAVAKRSLGPPRETLRPSS